MVDPSNSTNNVVHFMLPAVIQISKQVNNNGQVTEFLLAPSTNATSSSMHGMTNMAGM